MRQKIGEIKAHSASGHVTLNIFQEFEEYFFASDATANPVKYSPTHKSVETQDGQPVNFEPDKMEAQIVTTGELLQVDEVSYIV